MDLQQQRKDLDEAARSLESKIKEMQYQKDVLVNAFNAVGNGENIYEGNSILAQEARKIMKELINN